MNAHSLALLNNRIKLYEEKYIHYHAHIASDLLFALSNKHTVRGLITRIGNSLELALSLHKCVTLRWPGTNTLMACHFNTTFYSVC